MSEKIAADSGRFELEQIPSATKIALHQGLITSPVLNKTDNTASFAYIIQLHPKPEARNFNEARGLVINDYQNDLEKTWMENLRKKYPVRINKEVLDDLVRSSKP
jgi:peptidyl-prolyl cis-trans isomerase SurA